jgi:hypothetical protein
MSAIDDIEFKIARLDLRPGDILVVKCETKVTPEMARRMQEVITQVARGNRALILEKGTDLSILTAAEIEARSMHEQQGSGYDSGASGYEMQGRARAPTSDEAAV